MTVKQSSWLTLNWQCAEQETTLSQRPHDAPYHLA